MKLKVFVHAMDIGRGREILDEQVKLLETTGLLEAAEINIMMHFKEENFQWLKDRWSGRDNIVYHMFDESYKEWFEATTMNHIQESCHSSKEDFYVLCMTSKGMSHGEGGHQNWRKYMQYFTVEKWKECVAKLDEGYDLVGSPFLNNPPYPFMAGTFFWAKSSYLKKCRRLKPPPEVNFEPQFKGQPHHRFDLECWHGDGNPKAYDMNPGPDNRWYSAPESYREDMKDVLVFNTNA